MGDEMDPEAHASAEDTETPAQGYRHRGAEANDLDGAATSGPNDMGDVGIWWGRLIEGGNDTGADASADADGSAGGGSEEHSIPDTEPTERSDMGANANAAQDEELDGSVFADAGDRWQEAAAAMRQCGRKRPLLCRPWRHLR